MSTVQSKIRMASEDLNQEAMIKMVQIHLNPVAVLPLAVPKIKICTKNTESEPNNLGLEPNFVYVNQIYRR